MTVKEQIRTAALANAALAALIGASWFDTGLPQTSGFPAVVVQQISGSNLYSFAARMSGSYNRFQFTIWGGQFAAGAAARDAIAAALVTFLDQLNLIAIAGLKRYPNFVVGSRDFAFAQTDGPIFQKVVDAMIFTQDAS